MKCEYCGRHGVLWETLLPHQTFEGRHIYCMPQRGHGRKCARYAVQEQWARRNREG